MKTTIEVDAIECEICHKKAIAARGFSFTCVACGKDVCRSCYRHLGQRFSAEVMAGDIIVDMHGDRWELWFCPDCVAEAVRGKHVPVYQEARQLNETFELMRHRAREDKRTLESMQNQLTNEWQQHIHSREISLEEIEEKANAGK